MPKVDDGSTGIKSISKSQKTKGARDAKRAKLGLVKKHGGTCSSCGQTSNSCTTGSHHDGCLGYFQGNFGNVALNRLAEMSQSPMTADGSPIQRPVEGSWGDPAPMLARRAERAAEAESILRRQTHVIPIRDGEKVIYAVKFENGLGEPLTWHDGKWALLVTRLAWMLRYVEGESVDDVARLAGCSIATEDPGLTEKVSVEEAGEEAIAA